eukprot:TRINITY_DN34555_c0_g1_i1.p1 TRINITY_DN34555_c0_g1~~TRINITY_DN34555_c0_g1_i1.p1  ORF type:complete len:285 (+),score=25.41 TRINITY_DN34555_c0_g1_i1:67-855(+)
MGTTPSRPNPRRLSGSRLLTIAASQEKWGKDPTGVRIRVLVDGGPRCLDVGSKYGMTCSYEKRDGTEGDICEVLDKRSLDEKGKTRDWRISVTKIRFIYCAKSGDIEVTISGKGLLRILVLDEAEAWNWEPSEKRSGCAVCCRSFNMYIRKHHCRSCGRLVCYACSGNLAIVSGIPNDPPKCLDNISCCGSDTRAADKPSRVCEDCFYGPVMSTPLPSQTTPTLPDGTEDCYYDDSARLHILPPSNAASVLLHYHVRPRWDN